MHQSNEGYPWGMFFATLATPAFANEAEPKCRFASMLTSTLIVARN